MSAAEALMAARAAGIGVCIDGDDLVLEASAPPSRAVLDLLSRHKAGVVMLLRSADGRAGIGEFYGGLPRAEAGLRFSHSATQQAKGRGRTLAIGALSRLRQW